MTKDKLEKFKEDNKIKPPKIGQHILRKCNYNLQLLMTDDNYEIWRYDKTKGCFMEDGEHVIRNITQNLLGDYSTDYYVNEVVKWFKNRRKKGYLICRDELDGETRYIGLDNGVYDFEAGKLKEHNSTYKLTKKLPIRYNTDAKLTTGKKFLNDLTNDQKVIDTLQEMFGYTLWRRYDFRRHLSFGGQVRMDEVHY